MLKLSVSSALIFILENNNFISVIMHISRCYTQGVISIRDKIEFLHHRVRLSANQSAMFKTKDVFIGRDGQT